MDDGIDQIFSSSSSITKIVAESSFFYRSKELENERQQWIEVLVNYPETKKLYTYRLPADLTVKPGDIVSVPFGSQILGGLAIRYLEELPEELNANEVKVIEDVITSNFFTDSYWQLLERVAKYYLTDLIAVVNVALPPGLLENSQRRVFLDKNTILL
jgi:primosomal protein N' (replication factor Y) (superfamily II helicase)